ncbi:hypothetical protein FJY90_05785 [Candidatus Gottesmanbacteria bacterium]|nr:hypothetical protein [Candidatus Gottesmanbacteria bacterium]
MTTFRPERQVITMAQGGIKIGLLKKDEYFAFGGHPYQVVKVFDDGRVRAKRVCGHEGASSYITRSNITVTKLSKEEALGHRKCG